MISRSCKLGRNRRNGLLLALVTAAAPVFASAADAVPRELAVCADPANLPYSNERQEGFENRIASLIAADLHTTLRYTWNVQRRSFLRRTLRAGECDVVIGLPVGLQGVAQTRPYYASTYVFVTARQRGLQQALQAQGFDAPVLRTLKIGVQALGAEGANTPPAGALARRGIVDQVVGFPMWGEENDETPQARIVDAVDSGEIDVAVVWGPFAGYFARRHGEALQVTPATADPEQPALAFRYEMTLGVRRGDDALLAELQQALDRRGPEIRAILNEYGIPQVAMGTPAAPAGRAAAAAAIGAGQPIAIVAATTGR
jgi:mxaJ protein